MQFNRRNIVNGLAWAGATLIVAIPTADLIARQFSSTGEPQVAVVQETATVETPSRPSASAPDAASPNQAEPAAEQVATAAAPGGGDAVDSFIQSGRELPSYISGGGSQAAPATPAPATRPAVTTPSPAPSQPAQVATAPAPAATPTPSPQAPATTQAVRPEIVTPRAVTGFPTPVSQRPRIATAPAPAPIVQPVNPPLIIDRPAPVVSNSGPVVTAQDLEAWETGPLSDFLANRGGQGASQVPQDYEPGGFWLDDGPQNTNPRRLPPAYDDGYYYPFGQ
ncbi:MAG: hypothetical protein ABS75_16355 [Pelagibacterium sp. SCN 63-23]|nr:MAG: hypothetical protein ABS75_16355 [Pelagibacterium sp. SCN 63-23]